MGTRREGETEERPRAAGAVTRLAAQRNDPNRVSVFIDGAFAFGLHVDVLVEHGVAKGQTLTVEEQERLIAADRVRRAFTAALDYLSHRARTAHEVERRLLDRGYGEAAAAHTVERLRTLGYLDDDAFAREYVQARFRARGYGPRRIQADLRRRGVPAPLIEAALQEHLEEDAVLEAARRHAAKRHRRLAGEPDPRKRRQKLSAFLVRRGFSYDVARHVIDELEDA